MSDAKNHNDAQARLDALLGDEDHGQLGQLSDQAWADLAAQHEKLKAAFKDVDMPTDAAFNSMRANVLDNVKPHAKVVPFPRRLITWAVVAAVIACAFFIGQMQQRPQAVEMPQTLTLFEENPQDLMQRVRQNANTGDQLQQKQHLPYRYANIQIDPVDGQNVKVKFDLVRTVDMQLDQSDPLVSDLLVHSLLNPSPVASRLRAVQMAGQKLQPKVRQALVVTMLQDENFAVRERALQRLAPYIDDEKVSDAFLSLLKSDDNVQLRLSALDVLSKHPGSNARLNNLADELDQPTDVPLLMELERR